MSRQNLNTVLYTVHKFFYYPGTSGCVVMSTPPAAVSEPNAVKKKAKYNRQTSRQTVCKHARLTCGGGKADYRSSVPAASAASRTIDFGVDT